MSWRWSWLPFAGLLMILPYPGTVAARLLLLLIGFLVAAGWYAKAGAAERRPMPCKPALVAWWVVCLASLAYAADPGYSNGELKNELGYAMLALFSFFVLGQDAVRARFALRAAALGLAILGGWASLTWLQNSGWNRLGGHGDAGVVSTYVVTILPVLLLLAVDDPLAAWRRAAWALVALALFIAAITDQRAAWLALGLQAALGMVMLARAGRLPLSRRQITVAVGVLLLAAAAAAVKHTLTRYGGAGVLAGDTRMEFWPALLAHIAAHPLAGAGFGRQAMKIAYPKMIPGTNPELWHAHNFVINYGLGMGVPGILALLALFAAWGHFFWRHATSMVGIAGCMLLAGVFLRNQFNDFFQRDMSLLFWALCGLFAGMLLARAEAGR